MATAQLPIPIPTPPPTLTVDTAILILILILTGRLHRTRRANHLPPSFPPPPFPRPLILPHLPQRQETIPPAAPSQ